MKKILASIALLIGFGASAQDHFSGISTSNRVGILNGMLNPSEYANLSKKYEINLNGLSINVANNRIGFSDLSSNTNLEELIFKGNSPVNMRLDGEIVGPGFAMRFLKWGFGVSTKAVLKFDIIDVDPTIGDAIVNNNVVFNTTLLNNPNNQRLSGITYGEVGLSAARTLVDNEKHRFSAGITFKLLFPGSYSNFGLSNLNGTITQNGTGAYLTTSQPANLNIAYSGNLANSFTNFSDYTSSLFGGLNGMATDIGVNYQLKDGKSNHKIKLGLAIRNMGSMTFKDNNNYSSNYTLNIQPTFQNPQGLDLNSFSNIDNLSDVETILINNGYLTTTPVKKEFKVNLPTLFTFYGDFKILPKVYVTGYMQRKMKKDEANDQISALNIYSITPRVKLGFFEAYLPIANNDVSGTNVGFGFGLGGFYLGSGSIITALTNDSKQADFYTGFRWGFL
jgi:hypothetical protein